MRYEESSGPSLKETRSGSRELHHLRIYAGAEATPEKPTWLVEHHQSEDDKHPGAFSFDDGLDLLRHVAEHCAVESKEGD